MRTPYFDLFRSSTSVLEPFVSIFQISIGESVMVEIQKVEKMLGKKSASF